MTSALSAGTRLANCPDLVQELVSHFWHFGTDGRTPFNDLSSLAQCARVSRIFFTPSVKLIWEDLENWNPLLKVLSKSYGTYPFKPGYYNDEARMIAPIADAQWQRFQMYASFIKSIDSLEEDSVLLGLGFWALVARAQGKPLLPNLQRVREVHMRHLRTLEPLYFLPEGLREASLYLPDRPDEEEEGFCKMCRDIPQVRKGHEEGKSALFLQLLPERCPSITSLAIFTDGYGPEPTQPLLKLEIKQIARFRALEHLEVAIEYSDLAFFLRVCSKLPNLSGLSLAMKEENDIPSEINIPSTCTLQQLRSFELQGTLEDSALVFRALAKCQALLTSISFVGCLEPLPVFSQLLDLVSSSFPNVARLAAEDSPRGSAQTRFADIAGAVGDKFPQLQGFALDSRQHMHPIAFTDGDVHWIAEHWPALTDLLVLGYPRGANNTQDAPELHTETLEVLAQRCPALRRLAMPLTDAGRLSGDSRPATSSSEMREMVIIGAPADDAQAEVAEAYLARLFPNSSRTHYDRYDFNSMKDW